MSRNGAISALPQRESAYNARCGRIPPGAQRECRWTEIAKPPMSGACISGEPGRSSLAKRSSHNSSPKASADLRHRKAVSAREES